MKSDAAADLTRYDRAEGAPRPAGAYVPAVQSGNLVFTAGQGPIDPLTGELVNGSVEERTTRTLQNLEAVLKAVGADRHDVVKVTAHLESFELFERFDAAYRDFFGETLPARTTVESGLGGIQVELDAIAVVPQVRP